MTLPDPIEPTPDDLPEHPPAGSSPHQAVSVDIASDTPASNATAADAAARPSGSKPAASESGRAATATTTTPLPPELGGQKGPEPTRYGDWEKGGRCTDF